MDPQPYALIDDAGRILTWAEMPDKEANDANTELQSEGTPMLWLRLEFLN